MEPHSDGIFIPPGGKTDEDIKKVAMRRGEDFSPSDVHAEEECKPIGADVDEDCNIESNQEVLVQNANNFTSRTVFRVIGTIVVIVALLGAAVIVRQMHAINGPSDQNAYEQKRIVAPVNRKPTACTPFLGTLQPVTDSCCHPSCGQYCVLNANCKLGPLGPHACCVDHFLDLCGSVPMAPCILPKKLRGFIDMLVDVSQAITGNDNSDAAIKDALARTLDAKTDDIDLNKAVYAGGRRLREVLSNVFTIYEIRLPPTHPLNATLLQSSSEALKIQLKKSFYEWNVAVNLHSVQLSLPTEVAVGGTLRQIILPPPASE